MPSNKSTPKPASPPRREPPTVSGRWLLAAFAIAVFAAAFCSWAALCLLFWQGSWQLLYHPTSAVVRTPAALGLAFDPVAFAATDAGVAQLQGWWIPAASAPRYTVLYLHGRTGNLGDTLDDLAMLHSASLNLLAFDYRGYGQSRFAHPSEAGWREDADWALQYLTATRHIDPGAIVLAGRELGANLALELAASHPELAGVILISPLDKPGNAIFADPRAHLVPAHLLVADRYDLNAPAAALRIPSLWLLPHPLPGQSAQAESSSAFQNVRAFKMLVRFAVSEDFRPQFADALSPWLDDLHR